MARGQLVKIKMAKAKAKAKRVRKEKGKERETGKEEKLRVIRLHQEKKMVLQTKMAKAVSTKMVSTKMVSAKMMPVTTRKEIQKWLEAIAMLRSRGNRKT